jgi:RNA polymerase sigma-70 factor (ECF subfamily)
MALGSSAYSAGVDLEHRVRALCGAGDHHAATTAAIEGYGPELLGFLVVMMRDEHDASDVFGDLCVRLWRGLPSFRWDSSLRTWLYILARRACWKFRDKGRAHDYVPLSGVPEIDAVAQRVRTTTFARRYERRDLVQRLRAKLSTDEQALLTLRLDRELEWTDIARILADTDPRDEVTLARESAALRKKFERLKLKLRQLAAEEST